MIQDKIFFDEKDPTGISYNTPFTYYGSYQGRLWSKSPTGSIKYYTQNSDLSAYATTGSNQFSGSQTITGSLTVTGTITGTVAGTTATASYVEYTNVANKPALVSGSAQITGFGIFATTGSNTFQANQTITGSLFIAQNLVVAGSSSIQYISSSVLDIADNIITVNTFNPAIRFGGLGVIDSGSIPQVSGSMLFDSTRDQWIFVHQNPTVVTSSVVLMGPETYNDLGNESYISANRLPKGSGVEHLRDSNITDTGTVVSVNSNTQVTGSLTVTSTGTFSSTVAAGGNFLIPAGSGLAWSGDATRIMTPEDNVSGALIQTPGIIRFNTSGSNRMTITTGGNVGIGTSSPDIFSRGDERNVGISIPGASDNLALALNAGGSAGRGAQIYMGQGGTRHFTLSSNASETRVGTSTSTPLILTTNDTTRLTIAASTGAATFSSTTFSVAKFNSTYGQVNIDFQNSGTTFASIGSGVSVTSTAAADDTGIGTAGLNKNIVFATGASYLERMRITSAGNVGVGNTSPQGLLQIGANALSNNADASNAFNLKQTSTTAATGIYLERSGERKGYYMYMGGSLDSLTFQRNNAGTKADVMSLTRDGNVGIENDSPVTKLTLGSYSGSRLPYINGTGATFGANGITVTSANSGNAAIGGGLDLTNNTYSVNAYSPIISFSSLSLSAAYNNAYAGIWGQLGGPGGDSNWNVGALVFGTAGSYGINERMRINSVGNVGIGTTSADEKLTIQSGNIKLYSFQNTANEYRYIGTEYSSGNGNNRAEIRFAIDGSDTNTRLTFHTAAGGGTLNERMRITSAGDVGIGTTNVTGRLVVSANDSQYVLRSQNSSAGLPDQFYIQHNLGNVIIGNDRGTVTYGNPSDYRLKEDLQELNGLEKISQIKVYDYKWKISDDRMDGVLAHELQEIIPYAVTGVKDELYEDGTKKIQNVDYSKIVPVLIKAIQELKAKNDTLKSRIDTLEQA
jgi:hypothetical protein